MSRSDAYDRIKNAVLEGHTTVKEIAERTGYSVYTVHMALKELAAELGGIYENGEIRIVKKDLKRTDNPTPF